MLNNFYPHAEEAEKVLNHFNVDSEKGLTLKEAEEGKKKYGPNVLEEKRRFVLAKIFFNQLKNPLAVLLIIAGVITIFLKEYSNTAVIFAAVIINSFFGFIQEKQASDAFSKLKSSLKKYGVAVRDGKKQRIESSEIAPGDILILKEGDGVGADARIIEEKGLMVDESVLTGEWLASSKNKEKVDLKSRITEQSNMLFTGTLIAKGWARAVAVKTGKETEFGKIAGLLKEEAEKFTPFQKNIRFISRFIGISVVVIVAVMFVIGVLQKRGVAEMFLSATAVAVAAVPEGLPIAITVILILGMKTVLQKGGLVRKLSAAETLGSTDVILTDKTGTLTRAAMKVSHLITPFEIMREGIAPLSGRAALKEEKKKEESRIKLLETAQFSSDAFIENPEEELNQWKIRGGPMDKAILEAGIESGLDIKELFKYFPRIDFLPFDAERKFFAGLYQFEDGNKLFLSGAPETVLNFSSRYQTDGKVKRLTKPLRQKFQEYYEKIAAQGARIIAIAGKETKAQEISRQPDHFFQNLVLHGFIGFNDPVRSDVKNALLNAKNAGVRTVIVTGDNINTSLAVAEKIGFLTLPSRCLSGEELENMSKDELQSRIEEIDIFSRVLPHQKMAIVEAWQSKNKVVAMTGDGINDAPALKRADIGIALGSGTDVAKEASEIVLVNDSFNVIVEAIRQGRIVVDNMRKVIVYLLSTGFTEVILVGGTLFMGLPLPILPAQILWANIVQEGFMNFAYAFEKEEKNVMTERNNKDKKFKKIFTPEMKTLIFIIGVITDVFLFIIFLVLLKWDWNLEKIRTIMFVGVSSDAIFYALSLKSLKTPLWKINIFSNKYLLAALGLSVSLLISALTLPPLRKLLTLSQISFLEIMIILGIGITNLIAIELGKWIVAVYSGRSR